MGALNINSTWLGGRLTKTPVLQETTGSRTQFCNLLLAINGKSVVDFIEVNVYGELARQVVSKCCKGSTLFVAGKLQYDKPKSRLRVVAQTIQFIKELNNGSEEEIDSLRRV